MNYESRKGVDNRPLQQLLDRIISGDEFVGGASLYDHFHEFDESKFMRYMQTLFGVMQRLEIRDPLREKHVMESANEITGPRAFFPDPQTKKNILHSTFNGLDSMVSETEQDPEKRLLGRQALARTLVLFFFEVHPFIDGNGRMARLMYYLFSPHIDRSALSLQAASKKLDIRPKCIDVIVEEARLWGIKKMLAKRQIPIETQSVADLPAISFNTDRFFDDVEVSLNFIRLFDSWDAPTRERYLQIMSSRSDYKIDITEIDEMHQEGFFAFVENRYQEDYDLGNLDPADVRAIRYEFVTTLLEQAMLPDDDQLEPLFHSLDDYYSANSLS